MQNFNNDNKRISIGFNNSVESASVMVSVNPGRLGAFRRRGSREESAVYTRRYTQFAPLCLIYRAHFNARFDRFESAGTSARSPRGIYTDNRRYE